MFVLDFSPHLPRKTYPVRNVRLSPDAGTLAATFGKEGFAEHAAWWSLTDGKLIGTSSTCSPDLKDEKGLQLAEPVFVPDLSCCAVHGTLRGEYGPAEFQCVVLVLPGVEYMRGIALYPNWRVSDCDVDILTAAPNGRHVLAGTGWPR